MEFVALVSILLSIGLIQTPFVSATPIVKHYEWEVEYMFWSPDCKEGVVMGINGQFPGPTIRAKAGDTIVVNLKNKLSTEGVVLHWHGIRQLGTPWADGAAGVSQCAINPGETFEYKFIVDKAGTYFYHGHLGMQRSAGLYGSLIVDVAEGEKEPFHYDGEFSFLLSDWWHESIHKQEIGLSSKPLRWIGEPQSLLINGRGQHGCSLAAQFGKGNETQCTFKDGDQCAPEILHVEPNKRYRLRIASTTSLAALNLAVGGHKMVMVEADGNYVQPFTTDDIDIYSGESYSVIFTTDQDPTINYWISIGVRGREPKTSQALSLLNYIPTNPSHPPISPPPITPRWDDFERSKAFSSKILASMGSPKPPKSAYHGQRIILLNTQQRTDGFIKWAINNVTLSPPSTPYLGAIKHRLKDVFSPASPPKNFPESYDIFKPSPTPSVLGNGVYTFAFNTAVDVVLQNANMLNNKSEIHPWHLHGHDFWVLGYGEGRFKAGVDEKRFNLKNPPLRNTVVVFPHGWTALRFVADNPGVWFFHCHIEPHLHMGMGVVFAEGVNRLPKVPNEAIACGMTAQRLMKKKHN